MHNVPVLIECLADVAVAAKAQNADNLCEVVCAFAESDFCDIFTHIN